MKNLLLLSALLCSVILFGQNQPPVAVNDTIEDPIFIGQSFTFNVVANDYDPDGDYFRIKQAGGLAVESFTDSTITVFFGLDIFAAFFGNYEINYVLEDEFNLFGPESVGLLVLTIDNNSFDSLDINNINARFNAFGNHFWDLPGGVGAQYEFPIGSGKTTIFNFALWLGGMDENNELRIAGERYRQVGMDYWTGPLSFDEDEVWIDTATVVKWYKIWKLNKEEVEYHILHWQEPGYEPIANILEWPAHGETELGQDYYLAPFIDVNGNDVYEPMSGDYPLIRGDQSLFFIFNDQLNHGETQGEPIGIEIHGFAYAFDAPDNPELNNSTFLSYKIFNRSQHTLTDTYSGLFSDMDLGYAWDDFVGCDVARGAYYCYNGTEIDGNGEPEAYGENPPAQGIIVLGGPYIDADGEDNPSGECNESINGVGFGDGEVDNERYGMNHFVYFSNTGGVTGDPQTAEEYYNYMKGIWMDGTVMEYGGNGHVSSGAYGPACNFMFPGLSDPCFWGTNGIEPYGPIEWTESTAGNNPSDRRAMCSMGPFTLEPGGFHKIDIAFVTAQGDEEIGSVDLLMNYIDSVKAFYYEDPDHFGYTWLGEDEKFVISSTFDIYPNPAGSEINFDLDVANKNAEFRIYNSFGQMIQSGSLVKSGIHQIEISHLQKGVYILKILDGNLNLTSKFLKR
jgi:hypothetical protein